MRRTIALSTVGLLAISGAGTGLAVAAGSAHTTPQPHAAAASGHAAAIAAAKALVAEAPTVSGETSSAQAPSKKIAKAPPEGYTQLVNRHAYWTVNEPAKQALHDLAAQKISGLGDAGTGYSGGRTERSRTYFAEWFPTNLPTGIAVADLEIEVVQTGESTSAIAAFGQAVPAPPRPANEVVPANVDSVRVGLRTANGQVERANDVTGSAATTLIDDFDGLAVLPPGAPPRPCPLDNGKRDVVTFRWDGHVLKVASGFCGYTFVTSHGHKLKTLIDGGSFDHDIEANLAPATSASNGRD